jgi:[ribosomal protein S5]-alanine N-acetyltransferase
MKSRIETDRLVMRRLDPADAPALGAVLAANRDRLEGRVPLPAADADLAAVLAGLADRFDEGTHAAYAIVAEDRIVGMISLALDVHPPELGYWLDADATGRGYATEALQAMCGLAAELGFAQVRVRTAPDNDASRAVAEHAGFVDGWQLWDDLVGRLRRHLDVRPSGRGTATVRIGRQWIDLRCGHAEGHLWLLAVAPLLGELDAWEALRLGDRLELGAMASVDGKLVLRASAPLATVEPAWLVRFAGVAAAVSGREVTHVA